MKNAPGNFIHGKTYDQPYQMSKYPFWELIEDKPVLKIPPPSDADNVFDEPVYVADDDVVLEDGVEDEELDIPDPDAPATITQGNRYTLRNDEGFAHFKPAPKPEQETPIPVENEAEPVDVREEYKEVLTDAGVEFNDRARTTTLKKLVDSLESEE